MANLFQKDSDTIGLHIKNIFRENELDEKSTTEYFSVVQKEGKRNVAGEIKYYNLDAKISVGYRVKSKRGTHFRIWANKVLKEYLIKCYALNEKKMKEQTEKVKELEKSLEIFKRVSENYHVA
ncbi:MAG: RhuM family protein [Melioribacteraceae bacterium]